MHDAADQYLPLMKLLQKFGAESGGEKIKWSARLDEFAPLFKEAVGRAKRRIAELTLRRKRLMDNLAIRRRLMSLNEKAMSGSVEDAGFSELFQQRYAPLPSTAVLCLDLAFGSDRAGFFASGYLTSPTGAGKSFANTATNRVSRLAEYTLKIADEYAEQTGRAVPLVSTLLNAEGLPWQAHLPDRLVMGSRPVHEYARMGLTLTSVQDSRPLAFSPQDTASRIKRPYFDKLMTFARAYLPRLVNAPALEDQYQSRGDSLTMIAELKLHTLDDYSLDLATAAAPDALLLAWPGSYDYKQPRMFGQVQPWVTRTSDATGIVTLRSSRWADSSLQAFDFADDAFRKMNAALDFASEATHKVPANVRLSIRNTGFHQRSLAMFRADRVDLFGVTQALTLMPASTIEMLIADQNATPRHYSTAGVQAQSAGGKPVPLAGDGTAAMFVEPGLRFKLTVTDTPVINARGQTSRWAWVSRATWDSCAISRVSRRWICGS